MGGDLIFGGLPKNDGKKIRELIFLNLEAIQKPDTVVANYPAKSSASAVCKKSANYPAKT